MHTRDEEGFAFVLELVIVALVTLAVGFVWWRIAKPHSQSAKKTTSRASQNSQTAPNPNMPPLELKSIGFNLDYYNPATNMAGDMRFARYNYFDSEIWADFGQQDPRTSDQTKKNPQPTFYLPLDTPVHSLVDGEVIKIETLYSGDVSIMVAQDKSSPWIFELEHVIKPLVKVGDQVKGGQVIASVSSHGSVGPGIGILEIGILHPINGEAGHVCPFKYLDPAIKDDIGKKITALHKSWEDYLGKTVYKESFVSPGCVTENWVKG